MQHLFAAYGFEQLDIESDAYVDASNRLAISIHGHSSESVDGGIAASNGITLGYVGKIYNHAEICTKTTRRALSEQLIDLYLDVGTNLFDLIVGPLSIIIHDSHNDILLFGRDKTGINPFFYSISNDAVVVATTMESLLRHDSVQVTVNTQFIAEAVSQRVTSQTATPYADINRVKHGQYIQFSGGDITTIDYWTPAAGTTDYESWSAVLRAAVRDRVATHDQVGIKMSGGLDSTTITALCCETQTSVRTYSKLLDDVIERPSQRKGWSREQQRMNAMGNRFDITPTTISLDTNWPLKDEQRYRNRRRANPLAPATLAIKDRLYETITEPVVLTGHGGNMVDGDRWVYSDLVRTGELWTLLRNLRHDQRSPIPIFVSDILYPLALRRFNAEDIDQTGINVLTEEYNAVLDSKTKTYRPSTRIELQKAYEEYYYSIRDFRMLASRRQAVRCGLDIRYPYLDSRVFEYLFSTAPGELFSNGRTKGGFITEFEDILPDTVLRQDAKAYFTPLYTTALQKNRCRISDLLTNSKLETLGIVDSSKMDVAKQYPEKVKGIWELINVELWLQSHYTNC